MIEGHKIERIILFGKRFQLARFLLQQRSRDQSFQIPDHKHVLEQSVRGFFYIHPVGVRCDLPAAQDRSCRLDPTNPSGLESSLPHGGQYSLFIGGETVAVGLRNPKQPLPATIEGIQLNHLAAGDDQLLL